MYIGIDSDFQVKLHEDYHEQQSIFFDIAPIFYVFYAGQHSLVIFWVPVYYIAASPEAHGGRIAWVLVHLWNDNAWWLSPVSETWKHSDPNVMKFWDCLLKRLYRLWFGMQFHSNAANIPSNFQSIYMWKQPARISGLHDFLRNLKMRVLNDWPLNIS